MVASAAPRTHHVEFLYLDLDVCARCRGTEHALDEAVAELAPVLAATGVKLRVKKIQIRSQAQARRLGFAISPTIRIDGRDIQPAIKKSRCEDCGALCGECVDCRIWSFRGKEYAVPPKGMIMEAVLRAVFGSAARRAKPVVRRRNAAENLRHFLAGKRRSRAGCCV